MEDRRRFLAALFLPLTLCGLMLLIVSLKAPVPREYRWPVRISALLFLAPGLVLMFLATPFREAEIQQADDDWPEGHLPQARPGTMTPTVALPSPADRHPSLLYEPHPDPGDY